MDDFLLAPFLSAGFAAPIAFVGYFLRLIFEKPPSHIGIILSNLIPAILITVVIWLDGVPNNPEGGTTLYASVWLGFTGITAFLCGRLSGSTEGKENKDRRPC
jgi:hypothetical protein